MISPRRGIEPSAQGMALGIEAPHTPSPCKGKSIMGNVWLLPLQGAFSFCVINPGRVPWADIFLPRWGVSS